MSEPSHPYAGVPFQRAREPAPIHHLKIARVPLHSGYVSEWGCSRTSSVHLRRCSPKPTVWQVGLAAARHALLTTSCTTPPSTRAHMGNALSCDAGAGGTAALELKVLKALREKEENGELTEADAPLLEKMAKAGESNKAKLQKINEHKGDGGARGGARASPCHPMPQQAPRAPPSRSPHPCSNPARLGSLSPSPLCVTCGRKRATRKLCNPSSSCCRISRIPHRPEVQVTHRRSLY